MPTIPASQTAPRRFRGAQGALIAACCLAALPLAAAGLFGYSLVSPVQFSLPAGTLRLEHRRFVATDFWGEPYGQPAGTIRWSRALPGDTIPIQYFVTWTPNGPPDLP